MSVRLGPVDEVEFVVINDPNARQTALVTGDVDACTLLENKTLGLLARNKDIVVENVPSGQCATMPMHVDVEPFNIPEVRMALKLAMNREELIEDPRFTDNPARVAHIDEIDAIIGEWTSQRPAADILADLRAEGISTVLWATGFRRSYPWLNVPVLDAEGAFTPEAKGRYITSGHDSDLFELASTLVARYGDDYPIPRRAMPKWLVWLVGPIMDKSMTRKMIARNVDLPWRADNSKGVRELGLSYRPLQESMNDFFQQMIDSGYLRS